MDFILPLALGLAIGAAVLFLALRNKTVQQDFAPTSSTDLASSVQGVVQSALNEALSALNEQSRRDREESIKLAADRVAEASSERLGKSAKDIDTSLRSVQESLSQRMQQMDIEIKRLHDQNAEKFGNVDRAVNDLVKRTSDLNNVLSSSQARGQWGERMAEDMLRAAGFIEGANYKKQNTIEGGGRPDYTFMMPPDRVLYMDVKFPMDSYTAFVAAVDQTSRDSLKKDFIAAVRARVTELQKRDYAVVTTEHSLDYVLLFVPNESITGFIHEADPNLIDWALAQKVVLCSPKPCSVSTWIATALIVACSSSRSRRSRTSRCQRARARSGAGEPRVMRVGTERPCSSSSTLLVTQSSTWRSCVTSTSPPRNDASWSSR